MDWPSHNLPPHNDPVLRIRRSLPDNLLARYNRIRQILLSLGRERYLRSRDEFVAYCIDSGNRFTTEAQLNDAYETTQTQVEPLAMTMVNGRNGGPAKSGPSSNGGRSGPGLGMRPTIL